MIIRTLKESDPTHFHRAFARQGWHKPESQFRAYLAEQERGGRSVLVADDGHGPTGYLTIMWSSGYPAFRQKGIPEIVDFNVLKAHQRQGIGTRLLDAAEGAIFAKAKQAGLGCGVTPDYGAAMRLYVKRGYIPLGNGLVVRYRSVGYGDQVTVDDDVVIYFAKDRP